MKQRASHDLQAYDIPGVPSHPARVQFTQGLSRQLGINPTAHLICSFYSTGFPPLTCDQRPVFWSIFKAKAERETDPFKDKDLGAQPGPECSGRRRPGLPHLELPVAPLAPFLAPAPTSPSPGWENSCYSGAGDAARLNPRLSEPCCGLVPGALLGALKDLWVQPALRTVPSARAPLCP